MEEAAHALEGLPGGGLRAVALELGHRRAAGGYHGGCTVAGSGPG